MIFAAGVGSRLRPLTDTMPKALVEIEGVTMLERTAKRLIAAGADGLVVNTFHFAEQIEAFVKAKDGFGVRCELSRETELLETGGGLKKAAWFFDDGKPFFVHNVDVITDLDLSAMYAAHLERPSLATLAVQKRETRRSLLFDSDGRLAGRQSVEGAVEWAKGPVAGAERLAFAGIHVVSPELLPKLTENGVFPIMKPYLRLAGRGETIRAYRADSAYWQDIGAAAKLEEARKKARAPEERS